MTTTPETRTEIETMLAARLGALAKEFVTGLEQQGHLVEAGDAEVLERLRAQIDARRSCPGAFQRAIDTIVGDCGHPRHVAVLVAIALRQKGLLGDDDDPQPDNEPAPSPSPGPLAPAARGAVVVQKRTPGLEAAVDQRLTVERLHDQAPEVRPAAAVPADKPVPTGADWEVACAHAVTVAATMQNQYGARHDLTQIAPDRDRVTVAIRAHSLRDWEYWLAAIGAPLDVLTRTAGYAQLAAGQIDGVPVHLTAHDVPRHLQEAHEAAKDPFFLWGRIYDLGSGFTDQYGNVWLHLGQRQEDGGMPLLLLRGTTGPLYPLASIVLRNGRLTATDTVDAAVSQGAGGER